MSSTSSVLGICGFALSLILGAVKIWEVYRDRAHARVNFAPYVVTMIRGPAAMYSEVRVCNTGRRRVTINAVGVELKNRNKHFAFLCLPPLPITLDESQDVAGFILEGSVDLGEVRCGYARANDGRVYRSQKYRHKQQSEAVQK